MHLKKDLSFWALFSFFPRGIFFCFGWVGGSALGEGESARSAPLPPPAPLAKHIPGPITSG